VSIADSLIKDITTCPWCCGRGISDPEVGLPEGNPFTYMCEDCFCVWYLNDEEDYIMASHIRLDKMEW
jgi:hypothetical protein